MPWPSTIRALASRNYRLFCMGQGISLLGTWMQQVALSWLVYRLTHSPLMLGLVSFLNQIPILVLAPFLSVLPDHFEKRKILVVSQALALVQAASLALLTLLGHPSVMAILPLALLLGFADALDIPARQSFVSEMVPREHLANAIALNSSLVNLARFIGPPAAGIVVAQAGEGICFAVNAVSYLAVIASFLAMRLPGKSPARKTLSFSSVTEGFSYIKGSLPLRSILLYMALASFAGVPYQTLMPVFARDVFHGNSLVLGNIFAASASGALLGALYLASRKSILGLGAHIPLAGALFGASVMLFSRMHALSPAAFMALSLGGFGMMVLMASSNTLLQTISDDDKRGRVMGFFALAFRGMTPLGSLCAGSAAEHWGAPAALVLGGAAVVAGALWFALRLPRLRAALRPIYLEKGITRPKRTMQS